MNIVYFIIAWYVIGYVSLMLTYRRWGKVTVGEMVQGLLVALFGWFVTIICLVLIAVELYEKYKPYWDKIKDKEVF